MNQDFVDLLRAFVAADVRFMVVDAYALAVHGRPRATGDLDIWIDATPANAGRVTKALSQFGAPLAEITESDLARPGVVYQMGVAPRRIDILTELTGLTFAEAWPRRLMKPFGELEVAFIGREDFIANRKPRGQPANSRTSRGCEERRLSHRADK